MGKHSAIKMKRSLAMIIATLLIISTMPFILNFASTDDALNQIAEKGGTRYYDGAGTNGAGNQTAADADWAVSVTKTISDTLDDKTRLPENVFEITLKVETTEDVTAWEYSPDTAVVLSIDVSGSMANSQMGYPTQRANEFAVPQNPDGSNMERLDQRQIAGETLYVYRAADGKLYAQKASSENQWYLLDSSGYNWAASDTRTLGIPVVRRRISDVKKAAEDFITSYAGSAVADPDGRVPKRYLSIVIFGRTARVIQSWVDVGALPGNAAAAKGKISEIGDSTGNGTYQLENYTFLEGGLHVTRNLYSYSGNPVQAALTNRFVILLTDGNPNCFLNSPRRDPANASATQMATDMLADESLAGWAAARPYGRVVADEIRNGTGATASAKMYTIAYNTSADDVRGADVRDQGTADQWLREQIAYSRDYHKTATTNLDAVFESIYKSIRNWAEAWRVSDPMGAYIDFINDTNLLTSSSPVSLIGGNRLVWDLLKDTSYSVNSTSGVTTFIYKYRIRLNTLAYGFSNNDLYTTNGQTTLNYVTKKTENGIVTESSPIRADFTIPIVYGFSDGLTFTKVSSLDTGTGLANVEFELKTADDPAFSYKATSDGAGKVSFYRIPSGHYYTLTEANPRPALYRTAKTYTVAVEWGKLTVINDEDFDGNGGTFVNVVKPVPIDLYKTFSNADLSLFGVDSRLICKLEEHKHTAECMGWVNIVTNATVSSLDDLKGRIDPGDDDAQGDDDDQGDRDDQGNQNDENNIANWVEAYICGKQEHEHSADCYINDNSLKDKYVFTFTLSDAAGNLIASRNLELSRADILALINNDTGLSKTPYIIEGFFVIPADKADDGPFTITELNTNPGWAATEQSYKVDLEKETSLPVAASFHNEYGSVRRPWFIIDKHISNTPRGEYVGDIRFGLYKDKALQEEVTSQRITLTKSGGYSKMVMLDDYIQAIPYGDYVMLYIAEINDGVPGMIYDNKVYSLSIYHGEVTTGLDGVDTVEGQYIEFDNSYYRHITPEFTIRKITENGSGTVTFNFFYQINDNDPVSVSITTTGSGTADKTITLGANFTGTVKIWEKDDSLPKGWSAVEPEKTVTLQYNEGILIGDQGSVGNGTAVFRNTYKETPPPEPPPVTTTTGRLTVTKTFSGVTDIPAGWSAVIKVTGPGGYNESRTITGSNRTATFSDLNPGKYTITEINRGGIANYTFVSVEGEGSYDVFSGRTTNRTITNKYETNPPPTTPPPTPTTPPPPTPTPPGGSTTITEEGPPLAQYPPVGKPPAAGPPDEYVEIPPPPVPLGEMPPTGMQDSIVVWFYGICASMLAIGFILRAIFRGKGSGKEKALNDYKR